MVGEVCSLDSIAKFFLGDTLKDRGAIVPSRFFVGDVLHGGKMMHTMSEHAGGAGGIGVSVLPFDGMGLYEQPRPRLAFKMPRVVPDQKGKFENDELFRRLGRESEVS